MLVPAARLATAALISILVLGCASQPAPQAGPTLYARLGGMPAIELVAGKLIDMSSTDPATSRSFNKVNLVRLKSKLSEQLCAATGGPCKYTGDTMKASHAGLGITGAEFDGMVHHLVTILDELHVPAREKDELLAMLAPMKRDVVEAKRIGLK